MTSSAVFARAGGKELFLGHSDAVSTRPEALLMDLVGGLSGVRATLWAELQTQGEVRITAVPVTDVWADLSAANRYIHPDTGGPFLRTYPLGGLPFTLGNGESSSCAVAYWEELVFTNADGRREDIELTDDFEIPFTLQDGSDSYLEVDA